MANEYKLSYTAKVIDDKLGQIDNKLDEQQVREEIERALTYAEEQGRFDSAVLSHRWEGSTLIIETQSGVSSANLRGPSGVHVGSGDMPDDCNVQVDLSGAIIDPVIITDSQTDRNTMVTPVGITSEGKLFAKVEQTLNDSYAPAATLPVSGYAVAQYIKEKVSSVYKYKGSVSNYSDLEYKLSPQYDGDPIAIGDVYNVEQGGYYEDTGAYYPDGTNFAWTGEQWDSLGALFTFTNHVDAGSSALVTSGAVHDYVLDILSDYDSDIMEILGEDD